VYPQGGFADNEQHSFAYVTALNKHAAWPKNGDTSRCGDKTTYGVEAVIAYFGRNGPQGQQEFWLAFLDGSQFSSRWIAPDADQPNGFLGPHWRLETLERGGYVRLERDAQGQVMPFLRVLQETVLLSSTPSSSRWANRIWLYNHGGGRWDLKGQNTFDPPGSSQAVRDYTWSCSGGGIWSGILETYSDGEGNPDPRPAVRKVVYKDRVAEVTDRGSSYRSNLAIDSSFGGPSDGYRVYEGPSTGRYDQFSGGSASLRHAVARLDNGDDRQSLTVNGWPVGTAGYGQRADFDLGWLGSADLIDFQTHNDGGA